MKYSVGVIGGSGLYEIEGLEVHEERAVETPYGEPSDSLVLGELEGQSVAFLARHGRGHRLLPSELNFRANIWSLKSVGVEWLIGVSAVGSMKEVYEPMHLVIPDQFIDRTRHRVDTFFGDGLVAHVALADPICPTLADVLFEATKSVDVDAHAGGTYLCMEGPQFSTRAESQVYRQWGVDVIGMTNLQEARLAREAEICFATIAMVTDYDCWHVSEEAVTADAVMAVLGKNVETAQRVVRDALPRLADVTRSCACPEALDVALMGGLENVPPQTLERLKPLLARHRKAHP